MAGAGGTADFIVNVIFARWFIHGYTFYFFQAVSVIYDQCTLFVPDAQQCISTVPGKFYMGGRLTRCRTKCPDYFKLVLVNYMHNIFIWAKKDVNPCLRSIFV